jgi:hypothetical protein
MRYRLVIYKLVKLGNAQTVFNCMEELKFAHLLMACLLECDATCQNGGSVCTE